MTHDLRCERSRTDPRRCRCVDCGGTKHGVLAVVRERLGVAATEPTDAETSAAYLAALKEASA